MRFVLRKTTISFIILAFVSIVLISIFIILLGTQFEQTSIELRKNELKHLVTLGMNSIEEYRIQYAEGLLSKDEALELIRVKIRKLTYEDEVQPNYLFMSSYDGTMLVQPYQRELEGSNQADLIDADGKYIIRELISQARTGPGYVNYNYYPPGSDVAYPKLSYVAGLPEFECYIGTGIYSTDIARIKSFYFRQTVLFFVIIVVILVSGGTLVALPLYKSMKYVASCMIKLESDPFLEDFKVNSSLFKNGSDSEFIVRRFSEITLNMTTEHRALLEAYKERDRIMENALNEKEMLIKEMNHRVKNNLQIVISLLNLQKEKSDSSEVIESYNESISRMESISMIHQMLYQNNNSAEISGKDYLEQLIRFIIHSFGMDEKVKLFVDIEEIVFSIEEAVNIGLLTNEIITNAVKYAVPGNSDCRLKISLSSSDGLHTMLFSDNGPGIAGGDRDRESGLGLMLIKNIAAQLGGELQIESEGGTTCRLTF